MAKGIKSQTRTVVLNNNIAQVTGSDLLVTEVDMGSTRNALLVISMLYTTNALEDIRIVTSHVSDAWTSATAAPDSDLCVLVQDTANSAATSTMNNSSKEIDAIETTDGVYVYNVEGLRRYANLQYTAGGTGSLFTATLTGLDLNQAPYAAATTEY